MIRIRGAGMVAVTSWVMVRNKVRARVRARVAIGTGPGLESAGPGHRYMWALWQGQGPDEGDKPLREIRTF